MSDIKTIVGTFKAAERWLKLESLQIDILQFLIIGNISEIELLSKEIQISLYDDNILLSISCSSSFLPVAK